MRQHISSIKWPWFVRPKNPSKISSATGKEESFFSWVSRHTKCLLFLPPRNFSWGLLCLHHPSSLCKYTGILIENSQSVDSSLWSLRRSPMQYFPLHSQVINLPVIGETHWHLSIKWHLIYALFMPHLCAQVLQLFIKCPLLCQNMEIERRYSWYSQQTHQWTGSHWGPPLTVTIKSHPGDCVAGGAAFWLTGNHKRDIAQNDAMQFNIDECRRHHFSSVIVLFTLCLGCKHVLFCMFEK